MPRTKQDPSPQPHTTIAVVENNPVVAINSPERFSQFMAAMREQIGAHVPDTSTVKGRQEIISLSFKVIKSKTALESAAKQLKEQAQETVNKVNASIRTIREEMDDYAAEVRAPVTKWEAKERERQIKVDRLLEWLSASMRVLGSDTSDTVTERLASIEEHVAIDPVVFLDKTAYAETLLARTVETLNEALARLRQEEADRAELEQLRKDKAEADQRESLRLQAEREAALQRQREKDELAAAKVREAQAKKDAERRAEEEKAREKQRQQDLADAREQAAKDAIARAEQASRQEAQARQREADARAADTANRKRVTNAVVSCLTLIISPRLSPIGKNVTKTTPELLAQAITQALVEGAVPHCTLKF